MYSHAEKVLKIQEIARQAHISGKKILFRKVSTNTTRPIGQAPRAPVVDLESLKDILDIHVEEQWIDVEPRVPMDALVDEALRYKLLPMVVPEFPGITVGGAIQGGALESSSFRYGQFNDTVLEIEVVLGDGSLVVATKDNEFSDLFWGLSTSYGSLGIITRVRLPLMPAKAYVEVHMSPCHSTEACLGAIVEETGGMADFLEGIIFTSTESAMLQGRFVEKPEGPVQRLGRNIDPWYYRLVRKNVENGTYTMTVPVRDYLFRYDKGAFWMGEHLFPYFLLPSNALTRLLFAPFLHTRKLYDGLHQLGLQKNFVIQDLYMNTDEVPSLINYNEECSQIFPLWVCPIQSSNAPQKFAAHFREHHPTTLLNIGLYGLPASDAQATTLELEEHISNSSSRKMLYADIYVSSDTFWQTYDNEWYGALRSKYQANPFTNIFEKISARTTDKKISRARGMGNLIKESLSGKNVVWW